MRLTLTGYRIRTQKGSVAYHHKDNRKIQHVTPPKYENLALIGTQAEMIAAIRADGYKGKICPQYSISS